MSSEKSLRGNKPSGDRVVFSISNISGVSSVRLLESELGGGEDGVQGKKTLPRVNVMGDVGGCPELGGGELGVDGKKTGGFFGVEIGDMGGDPSGV